MKLKKMFRIVLPIGFVTAGLFRSASASEDFFAAYSDAKMIAELRPGASTGWAAALNAYHLFQHIEEAGMFRDFSDHRSPEHAPFCVYSIWKIAELP